MRITLSDIDVKINTLQQPQNRKYAETLHDHQNFPKRSYFASELQCPDKSAMATFSFTGDWSPYVEIPALNDFKLTHKREAPAPEPLAVRTIQLLIEDQETLDPDPLPQQLAAINYLLEHQDTIAQTILSKVYEHYPNFYESEVISKEGYPPLSSPGRLRSMFEITYADVKTDDKDGFGYISLNGRCSWYEGSGYGIGILLHKDRVVAVAEDRDFFDEIRQDGGHSSPYNHRGEVPISSKRLYLYSPHPKYGMLKPWQQKNNYTYPYNLIARRLNEDFIIDIELGLLSVDHEAGRLRDTAEFSGMTFLEYACECGNEPLIRFILSKKPASLKNCLYHVSDNREMIQLLLDAGVDINEVHRYRGTAIARQADTLHYIYMNGHNQKNVENKKNLIQWLIAHGADPYVKDSAGHDAFYPASWLPEVQGKQFIDFLKSTFERTVRR
jgi:hypothetical protein